jgi:hypothetical protein
MRAMKSAALVGLVLLVSACASAPPVAKVDPAAAEKEIMKRVDSLLYRYSQNDQPGMLALLDQRFVIMGSGPAELIDTRDKLQAFMSNDFAQWGVAKYSDVRNVDVRVGDDLATAYFTLTWAVGNGGPTLPIRLCTTWHKVNGEWLLTQSANAVMVQ